ncbi:MAG: serine hydrolase, partial [Bacteroidetes bacterium]|nr:serine hydrolase [Bacteroidota bacterium]
MKKLAKVLAGIAIFIGLLILVAKLTGNGYLVRGVWITYLHGNNSATIDDAKFFKTHPVQASDHPSEWPLSPDYNKKELPAKLREMLTRTETVAFVVIKNDSIL